MGEVYKARDTRLGRTVAIKILPECAAADPDRRRRFEHEARAASSLDHPNICVLHDIGCEVPASEPGRQTGLPGGPLHFLVMEYLDGETLAGRLRDGPLPLPQALDLGAQIADALAAAHGHGIVHRDLKPGNLMLVRSRGALQIKLLDFGLAKLEAPCWKGGTDQSTTEARHPTTAPGVPIGTLPYMAPEQLEGKEADARADLFAIGCVLFEMLTGRRAFAGESRASVISAIMTGGPPSASTLQPLIPHALDRLISSCLVKDRNQRRQSAHDLADDLRGIAEGDSSSPSSPPAAPSSPTATRFLQWPPPRRLGAFVAALALVALAVAAQRWLPWRASDGALLVGVPAQLTSASGLQAEPAVSPDGTLVAYVSDEGGGPHIWIVDQDGSATLQLTSGTHAEHDPTWLPDNSAVLFTSRREGRPGIWKVARLGGAGTLVVANAADGAVSPDGTRIAFVREVSPSGENRVFVAPLADTASARMVTTDADGRWDHRQPAWSPDGGSLCYRAQQSLWIVSPDRSGARRLTRDDETALDPAWLADGESIVYTSLREGTAALWKVNGRGAVSRVTLGSGPERHPSVSRDGRTLAYSTEMVDRNIVLHDLATGSEQSFGTLRAEYMPAFCAAGASVLFASDRVGGRDELWVQPLAGARPSGEVRRLTNHPGNVSHPACSSDGRWIAYYRVVEGQRHIWTMPSDGGPPVQFTKGDASEIHPAWSGDGSKLAYAAERGGDLHIWVAPVANGIPAGPAVEVTRGSAAEMAPDFSPDGAWVAYRVQPTTSEAEVWVTAADGRGAPRRVTSGAGAFRLRWLQPRRMLVSGSWGGTAVSVRVVDPVTGAVTIPNPPVVFGEDEDMCDFDASPDGRTLVYARTSRKGNIWRWSGRF